MKLSFSSWILPASLDVLQRWWSLWLQVFTIRTPRALTAHTEHDQPSLELSHSCLWPRSPILAWIRTINSCHTDAVGCWFPALAQPCSAWPWAPLRPTLSLQLRAISDPGSCHGAWSRKQPDVPAWPQTLGGAWGWSLVPATSHNLPCFPT